MSQLLHKSNLNKQAAELLIGNDLHAPSIHCSYYHCVQYMKHLAMNKFGLSEKDMEGEMNFQHIKGTHKYLIGLIAGKIREIDKEAVVDFKGKIQGLQTLRETSDYKDEKIKLDQSMAAYETSKEVKQFLKDKLA